MYARVLSGLSVIWVGAPMPSSMVSVIRLVDMSMTLTAPPRARSDLRTYAVPSAKARSRIGEPTHTLRSTRAGSASTTTSWPPRAAGGIGGGAVQPLAGGVDRDGVDADACAGGEVDGADTLGGGVDDGDVDV